MPIDVELDGIFSDELAETVTYNPSGKDPEPDIAALIDRDEYVQEITPTGEYLIKSASLMINTDAIGIPNPVGDTVTMDGLEWAVTGYEPVGANIAYIVRVTRRELVNKRVRM